MSESDQKQETQSYNSSSKRAQTHQGLWRFVAPKRLTPYEFMALFIELFGFIIFLYSLKLLTDQTTAMTQQTQVMAEQTQLLLKQNQEMSTQTIEQSKALESSAYQGIIDNQLELNKIFLDNPELRPFFFDNQEISPTNPNYRKALAAADYQLDFFDLLMSQSKLLTLLKPGSTAWAAWQAYMRDTFEHSPIVCKQLTQTQRWYASDLLKFARANGCSSISVPNGQAAKPPN
ncbi:MAG: hypothetical protein VKJ46_02510 [Leptolyngbyaceae bacterium]|nr:hypothetical protein [Leptolyngbyaceae bacterium]